MLQAEGHAALYPSSEFPVFAAPEPGGQGAARARLTSDRMGFFSTGGVMTYIGMAKGLGLHGTDGKTMATRPYVGGARGGYGGNFDMIWASCCSARQTLF